MPSPPVLKTQARTKPTVKTVRVGNAESDHHQPGSALPATRATQYTKYPNWDPYMPSYFTPVSTNGKNPVLLRHGMGISTANRGSNRSQMIEASLNEIYAHNQCVSACFPLSHTHPVLVVYLLTCPHPPKARALLLLNPGPGAINSVGQTGCASPAWCIKSFRCRLTPSLRHREVTGAAKCLLPVTGQNLTITAIHGGFTTLAKLSRSRGDNTPPNGQFK